MVGEERNPCTNTTGILPGCCGSSRKSFSCPTSVDRGSKSPIQGLYLAFRIMYSSAAVALVAIGT